MASYSTSTSGATGSTHSSTTTTGDGKDSVKEGVQGVKGVLAGIHGVGEKVRGELNAGIDEAFNENGSQEEGVRRNAAVANAGEKELDTGNFAQSTKNREGAAPGDNERRY